MSDQTDHEELIFEEALKCASDAERLAFLDKVCRDKPGLRTRLDLLLEGYFKAEGFLSQEPQSRAGEEPSGTIIGRYKLLQKIGEGGMGVVYMAEQREPVVRKVALKIIKAGMDTRQVIARFEAERQALALMDHPNIAKVLDGGETQNGRPYFVMDLVQGLPITQFCDEARLATRERLELFLDVCSAIQHAHQKGIIHRDIKPSNILVTLHGDRPVPKVIDFGIAKATQQPLTDKTLFTQFQHFIGTPAYMSPEQASLSGLDIDTRSDIYGLGVLLYELLTGKTPFDGNELLKSGLDEMRRTIREKEPPRPSVRLSTWEGEGVTAAARRRGVDALKLVHLVRGDLDWIAMKCLEKDRARRYDTANGLAADVRRHLDNEPVVARPPSTLYRLQKSIRRHRLAFVAGGAVALALLGGIAASSWQARRATRAEQVAKAQARLAQEQSETAQAVQHFLTRNLLGGNFRNEARELDPLDVDTKRLLAARIARKMEGQFTNQPLVEAEIRSSLSWAFNDIRDFSNVIVHAERVLDIYRRLPGPPHSNTLYVVAQLAVAKYGIGRKDEAFSLLSESEVAQTSTNLQAGCAACLAKAHGHLLFREERFEEALVYYRRALALATREFGATNEAVKDAMVGIAEVTKAAGRLDEAEELFDQTLGECYRDLGTNHETTVWCEFGFGRLLVERNRGQAAQPLLERAVAWRQVTIGTNHISTLDAHCFLAKAFEQQGEIRRATGIFVDLGPRVASQLPFRAARFLSRETAQFFARHRRFDEARFYFESLRASYETEPPGRAWDWECFIEAAAATKGWPATTAICRKYLDRFPGGANTQRTYSNVLLYGGDHAGYQQVVARALAVVNATTNRDDHRRIAEAVGFGPSAFSAEQRTECEALLESLEGGLETASTNQSSWHRAIAGLQLRRRQFTGSLAHVDKALENLRPGSERARLLALKTVALHHLGRDDEARISFEQAEALMKSRLLDSLKDREGFLTHEERTYLIFRREARALLGLK